MTNYDNYLTIDTNVSATASGNKKKYTVTYDLNGGAMPNNESTTLIVEHSSTLELPIPVKKGHNFKGWFTGTSVNDSQFTNKDAVFKDLILTAKWELKTYQITFKLSAEGNPYGRNLAVKYGEPYTLSTGPNIGGLRFIGWYLNDTLMPSTGIYNYESDITLIARFSPEQYKITLDLNGGTYNGSKEIIVTYGEPYVLPKTGITNGDAVFIGWYDGNTKFEFEGDYKLSTNITLVAKWEILETYNLNLDFNGGTSASNTSLVVTNGDFCIAPVSLPVPSKPGFEFYGYSFGNYLISTNTGKIDLEELRMLSNKNGNVKNFNFKAKYIGLTDSNKGEYYRFGAYPQTLVRDSNQITELSKATDLDNDGFIDYNNEEYLCVSGFYFYKLEPIVWEVKHDGTLVSSKILNGIDYYKTSEDRILSGQTIHSNNYKYSRVRAFLNGYDGSAYRVDNFTNSGFYDVAFNATEKARIKNTLVDNSLASTGHSSNPYVCEDTNDKIYLLSNKEINDSNYGYNSSLDKIKKVTDYAFYDGLTSQQSYWLRSPGEYRSSIASLVSDSEYIDGTIYNRQGVVPALKI